MIDIVSTVSDLDRSVGFYADILAFERDAAATPADQDATSGERRVITLTLGDESIVLQQFTTAAVRPYPPFARSNDGWFQHLAIVVSDMDRAYERLRAAKVTHISSGPQTLPDWNQAAAGIKAFYFRDPDGHPLELIWYPPGKGRDKWHAHTDRLFLGIDHTAIAIADTDASLQLYRDVLGFHIAGQSENFGSEQEHLNGVFGSRVRITSLRGDFGPGIELLEYIAPADGRPSPGDLSTNDLAHRVTRMSVTHPMGALKRGSIQELRDPDGHPLQISHH